MKKLLVLFSMVVMLVIASCNGGAKYEAISEKIQNGEQLTQADYKMMLEYIKKPFEESIKLMKEAASATTPQEMRDLSEKSENILNQYPFAQEFSAYLQDHYNDLDEANQAIMMDILALGK